MCSKGTWYICRFTLAADVRASPETSDLVMHFFRRNIENQSRIMAAGTQGAYTGPRSGECTRTIGRDDRTRGLNGRGSVEQGIMCFHVPNFWVDFWGLDFFNVCLENENWRSGLRKMYLSRNIFISFPRESNHTNNWRDGRTQASSKHPSTWYFVAKHIEENAYFHHPHLRLLDV